MRLVTSLVLAVAVLGLSSCQTPPAAAHRSKLLILVSLDGFRWDYLQKYEAPTLKQLAAEGVHAKRMTPSFPSKTFPNHYTLVTGLRPEHHGIVSNYFYDTALQASFSKALPSDNEDPRWWEGGEPIWITAEKQGVRSGVYFWPGSEAPIHGLHPSLHLGFDGRATMSNRVDGLLGWLDLPPEKRPQLCALYLDITDVVGHKSGPEGPEMAQAVKVADEAVARLLAGLEARHLREQTDLVVVSDHGMSEQSIDRVAYLDDMVDLSQVDVESSSSTGGSGPNGGLRPKPGTITPAELAARMRAKAPPQVQIYPREEVPARYHYSHGPRIPAVVFIADDHWVVETHASVERFRNNFDRGNHGWDPATPNMGALFIAHGPSFRRAHEFADVENIHLYNFLCAALGIKPAANDGDDRLAREVLNR